jgi:hypothetical protein
MLDQLIRDPEKICQFRKPLHGHFNYRFRIKLSQYGKQYHFRLVCLRGIMLLAKEKNLILPG